MERENKFFNLLRKGGLIFPILFIAVLSSGCNRKINRIIEHQDEIIALSRDKVIEYSPERHLSYKLFTYKRDEGLVNEYYFCPNDDQTNLTFKLVRDTIQFSPDIVIGIDKNDSLYEDKICEYYQKVAQVLYSHGIKCVSDRPWSKDPELKLLIYVRGGGVLEYWPKGIPDRMHKEKVKEVGKGWYLENY